MSAVHGVHRVLQAEDHEETKLHSLGYSRIAARARRRAAAPVVAAHVSSAGLRELSPRRRWGKGREREERRES